MNKYLIALLAYLVWRVIQLSRKHNWRSSVRHEAGLALFAVFFIWLMTVTLGPPWRTEGPRNYNFIPFQVVRLSLNDWQYNHSVGYFTLNLLGNIAVFIPVGFFIFLLWEIKPAWCVLTGLTISLGIECVQYPIGRWTDIDDLMLNTLGTLIGVLLCLGINALTPKFLGGFKAK
jgi:glycopeptide antibiotics resistance protein